MPLFRFIRRQSNVTADAADEILQNAFVRAFRSLQSIRDPSKFDSWMLRIARRETLRYVGRQRKDEPLETHIDSTADEQQHLAAAREKERLMTLIRELVEYVQPETVRETARRYYLTGERCTTEQLANVLEIPHATVRKRLYLFRKKLRDLVIADWSEIS